MTLSRRVSYSLRCHGRDSDSTHRQNYSDSVNPADEQNWWEGSKADSNSGVRWDEAGVGVDVGDNFSVPCSQVKSVKRGNFFNNAWSNDFYLSIPKKRYRFDAKDGSEAKAIIKVIEDHCGKH